MKPPLALTIACSILVGILVVFAIWDLQEINRLVDSVPAKWFLAALTVAFVLFVGIEIYAVFHAPLVRRMLIASWLTIAVGFFSTMSFPLIASGELSASAEGQHTKDGGVTNFSGEGLSAWKFGLSGELPAAFESGWKFLLWFTFGMMVLYAISAYISKNNPAF